MRTHPFNSAGTLCVPVEHGPNTRFKFADGARNHAATCGRWPRVDDFRTAILLSARPDPTKYGQPVVVRVGADDHRAAGIEGMGRVKSVTGR